MELNRLKSFAGKYHDINRLSQQMATIKNYFHEPKTSTASPKEERNIFDEIGNGYLQTGNNSNSDYSKNLLSPTCSSISQGSRGTFLGNNSSIDDISLSLSRTSSTKCLDTQSTTDKMEKERKTGIRSHIFSVEYWSDTLPLKKLNLMNIDGSTANPIANDMNSDYSIVDELGEMENVPQEEKNDESETQFAEIIKEGNMEHNSPIYRNEKKIEWKNRRRKNSIRETMEIETNVDHTGTPNSMRSSITTNCSEITSCSTCTICDQCNRRHPVGDWSGDETEQSSDNEVNNESFVPSATTAQNKRRMYAKSLNERSEGILYMLRRMQIDLNNRFLKQFKSLKESSSRASTLKMFSSETIPKKINKLIDKDKTNSDDINDGHMNHLSKLIDDEVNQCSSKIILPTEQLTKVQIQMKVEESLDSTVRMVKMCEECSDAGLRALVMLDEQGEQNDIIEKQITSAEDNINTAEQDLEIFNECWMTLFGYFISKIRKKKRCHSEDEYNKKIRKQLLNDAAAISGKSIPMRKEKMTCGQYILKRLGLLWCIKPRRLSIMSTAVFPNNVPVRTEVHKVNCEQRLSILSNCSLQNETKLKTKRITHAVSIPLMEDKKSINYKDVGYIRRIQFNEYEDSMDKNVSNVNDLMRSIRQMALDIGTEIDAQNLQLTRCKERTKDIENKVQKTTKKTMALLLKKNRVQASLKINAVSGELI
ncbi:hypothetical protein SNEBB_004514 [Seison nebaliae]|nr:hypothetical protein SNEBB_004514 [Seison nebaliae]